MSMPQSSTVSQKKGTDAFFKMRLSPFRTIGSGADEGVRPTLWGRPSFFVACQLFNGFSR